MAKFGLMYCELKNVAQNCHFYEGSVALHCGGILDDSFITSFSLSAQMKKL